MSKRVSNLWDSGEVERYIKESELSNGRKNLYGQADRDWCNWKGFDYKPVRYKKQEKLPYIPTENEIDQLIAGNGPKLATFLQIMKESAFRPSEAQSLTTDDFNLATKACTLNTPAKNSRPRQFDEETLEQYQKALNFKVPDSVKEDSVWIKMPVGQRVTCYGVGVSLLELRNSAKAHKTLKLRKEGVP